jgi:hypothetical protein
MRRPATALRWTSCTIFARTDSRFPFRANDRGAIRGLLFPGGDGRGIGERDGVPAHFLPSLKIVLKTEFGLEFVEGAEQEFADEGEVGSVAGRDAVLGDSLEEFAEGEVDVRGGHESASESGSEFGAKAIRFNDLALGASVENTERRVIELAKHATGAAVGERELTERGFVGGDAGTGAFWFIHGFFLERE